MRLWIRQIHFYCGLLVSPYLIILGLSAFNYNHRDWFPRYIEGQTAVEHSLNVAAVRAAADKYLDPEIPTYIHNPPATFVEDRAFAQAVRDELGLYGNLLQWEMRHNSEGVFRFPLNTAIGHGFKVRINEAKGTAEVTPIGHGFWPATLTMHGLYKVPNSRFLSSWGYYTELMVWAGLFFAASGLYLWFQRRGERIPGLIAVLGGFALSAAMMFYAWSGG